MIWTWSVKQTLSGHKIKTNNLRISFSCLYNPHTVTRDCDRAFKISTEKYL